MIRDEIFKSLEKSGCLHDLLSPLTGMIAHKNELLLPSVTRWDGEFIGICSLICREEKLYSDILEVAEYLRDQYRSGWGADFSKRGISTPLGQLFVNFCGNDPDKLDIHQCC